MNGGSAELLGGNVLRGNLLDDLGPGQEHVGALVHHHHIVCDGGGVDRATGAGSHDQGDLGDDAGVEDVAEENIRVSGQSVDSFLNPRPTRVVHSDERGACLGGHLHDFHDLLRVALGEGSAEDCEILSVEEHQPAVDGPVSGDNAVGKRLVLGHFEILATVGDEEIELFETTGVNDPSDPLTSRKLPLLMLLLYPLLTTPLKSLLFLRLQVE